jgi:hypothetical protein
LLADMEMSTPYLFDQQVFEMIGRLRQKQGLKVILIF